MDLTLRASEGATYRPSRFRRLAASFGLISGLTAAVSLVSLPCALAAHSHHRTAHGKSSLHPALVRVSTAKLRENPDAHSKTTALLDEGRSAVVVGRKAGYVHVRLDSGREGWLRGDLVDVAKSTVHNSSDEDSPRRHRHESADSDSGHSRRAHHVTQISVAEPRSHAAHSRHIAESTGKTRVVSSLTTSDSHPSHVRKQDRVDGLGESGTETAITDNSTVEWNSAADSVESMSPATRSRGERLVNSALAYRGTPYRMGATGNGAFDCSGFTMYLFGKEGSSLPRTAAEQYEKGTPITKDHLRLGDLVFFRNTYKSGISHVGIYIGNNSFVHASGYGRGVRVDSLGDAFYINHWAGARRPR